jgi:hypothetical protein
LRIFSRNPPEFKVGYYGCFLRSVYIGLQHIKILWAEGW